MSLFPMFLKLEGRSCLVVGAGAIGQSKIRSLLVAGASVHVVAPQAGAVVVEWARSQVITWEVRGFCPEDLDGAFLAVAATSSPDLNKIIFREARRRNVLCNVVDDPEHCDFYYPAVVRRGELQIAISTGGLSPALAQRLRRELGAQFGPEYAGWIERLGKVRQQLFASDIDCEERRRRLHKLARGRLLSRCSPRQSTRRNSMTGKVYLVGAGPGDPELLTLKALRVLKTADVVLHDELIGPDILAFVPSSVQVHNVGKRCGPKNITQEAINALLVNHALLGVQVVRLKGGDPFIFGRGGEEIEALRKANIDFEIVPGVTAALGAAAATQIPLTHRQVSSALIFLTSHRSNSAEPGHWPEQISPNSTLVIYMPGYNYESIARRLLAAGLEKTTPSAIISQATSRAERVYKTTVEDLPLAPRLPAPTLLVVGEVVRFAEHASLRRELALPDLDRSDELVAAQAEFFLQRQPYRVNPEHSG